MKITTKIGDSGETLLFGGRRVSKGDAVVDVLGELDELQAFLGWCKCEISSRSDLRDVIERVQGDLGKMMGVVGCGGKSGKVGGKKKIQKISEEDVEWLEEVMKKFGGDERALKGFVKPGVNEASSRFHIARTVCRRVERGMVKYLEEMKAEKGDGEFGVILKYLNRLSDLLFVLGCSCNAVGF
jgi:cob(I)alamin adenosyltransferase